MAKENSKITKGDLNRVYIRNLFGLQWGWNYEKMQGLGYTYVMMPVLKRLYKDDPDQMKTALKTHLSYFNTTPAMSHLIVGADIGMEEEFGMNDPEAILGLKTGLMGPFAGVGDTIFVAIYRAIVFSIASYMALQGNPAGLAIPLIFGAAVLVVRRIFTNLGYSQGKRLATDFADRMQLLTEGASILGLTVVGALIPSVISYKLDLTFAQGDVEMVFQDMLDKIMPGIIPLGIVLGCYFLLGKKKVNSTGLIFILILLGMILGNLQNIFAFIGGLF